MVETGEFVTVCIAYPQPSDRREAELVCGIQDNARIEPVLNVAVTHAHGLHSCRSRSVFTATSGTPFVSRGHDKKSQMLET